MKAVKNGKIVIIGAGHVGSHCGHTGLFRLRSGEGRGPGGARGPGPVFPGVSSLPGPMPLRGLCPCEGAGLRRSGGPGCGEDRPQPARELCAAV